MLDSDHSGPATPPPDQAQVPQLRRELRSWTRDLAVALGLALVIIIFLYQPVKVEGTSMAPLLSDQERIFINKFVYRFEPIDRGDVVVFWYPLDRSKSFIKRVIGLPGDSVEIRSGHLYLNGHELQEPYVPASYLDGASYALRKIPSDEYFADGRSSRQLQRFAHVRHRPARLYLWKGRVRLLARWSFRFSVRVFNNSKRRIEMNFPGGHTGAGPRRSRDSRARGRTRI